MIYGGKAALTRLGQPAAQSMEKALRNRGGVSEGLGHVEDMAGCSLTWGTQTELRVSNQERLGTAEGEGGRDAELRNLARVAQPQYG